MADSVIFDLWMRRERRRESRSSLFVQFYVTSFKVSSVLPEARAFPIGAKLDNASPARANGLPQVPPQERVQTRFRRRLADGSIAVIDSFENYCAKYQSHVNLIQRLMIYCYANSERSQR